MSPHRSSVVTQMAEAMSQGVPRKEGRKMDLTNAQPMEMLRRLVLSEDLRELGVPSPENRVRG
jgi:hypothetical protein